MRKSLSLFIAACFVSTSFTAWAQAPAELTADRQAALKAVRDKNPDRAVRLLSRWSKEFPYDLALANDYAYALAQVGKVDQAREVLETALSKNEAAGPAFTNLREILSRQASQELAKALGQKPPPTRLALRLSDEGPAPQGDLALADAGAAVKSRDQAPSAAAPRPTAPAAAPSVPAPAPVVVASAPAASTAAPAAAKPAASSDAGTAARSWPSGMNEDMFVALMQKWAQAWAAKDIDTYLGMYAQAFQTQAFSSREAWAQSRRVRIVRPGDITVEISDVKAAPVENDQVEVRFRQRYDSPTLKVNSNKRVLWIKEGASWKILREDGR